MFPKLILLASLGFSWWLIKRDVARREGLSSAIWIPTIWVAIIGSRPVSMWLGFGGGSSTMEGSPVDGLIFLVLIVAAFVVLGRRSINWSTVIVENWPIFLFYLFLLISVFWANSPFVSFKRWFKEFGNIVVLLVILTEARPLEALRAVVVRCACLLLPLSIVLIRYFPSIGRFYSAHGGEAQISGVTCQKNSLGVLVLVCALVLFWDWLELRASRRPPRVVRSMTRLDLGLIALALYLMYLCQSKTSLVCLILGGAVIAAARLSLFQRRPRQLMGVTLAVVVAFWLLDQTVGVTERVVTDLGKDMTFTGRTDVWRELLDLHTDPVLGVGFMSFWDDEQYQSKLPYWCAYSSAHSGYMEEYLGGGWVCIFFLVIMFLGVGWRICKDLDHDGHYGAVRLAFFFAFLIGNFSESNIACMTPFGFMFLLTGIGHAGTAQAADFAEDFALTDERDTSEAEAEEAIVLTYES